MRRDPDYNDYTEEELERQREIIERKLKNMSYEDERTARSSKTSSKSSASSGKNSSSGGKVRRISPDDIEYSERQRRSSGYKKSSKKKKRKKKRKAGKVFAGILIAAVLIAAVMTGAVYYLLGGLTHTELEGDVAASDGVSYIKNIALFGVDTRDSESNEGRSDAIMIMSINKRTGQINLISVLRDSYVAIDGYGSTKINAAYAYGGATLAVKTLNQNFDLDITDYITVNFAELAQIIDATGGVTIKITASEAEQINKNLDDAAKADMTTQEIEYVTVADQTVTLNGDQAVAYSRIRKIDSDNVRASRQQTVLSALLNNIKNMSVLEYPSFIHEFMSVSESSLTTSEFVSLAPLIFKDFTINTYTVPDADYETDLTSGYDSSSQWCWFYDTSAAASRIHNIIYGE